MKFPSKRIGLVAGLAVLSLGVVGVAVAASTPSTPTNQTSVGRGINDVVELLRPIGDVVHSRPTDFEKLDGGARHIVKRAN